MIYDEIEHLRANHPAWSLLRSPNASLVMSFLGRVFIERNIADIPAAELAGELRSRELIGAGRLLEELYRRRAEVDEEIERAERGEIIRLDPVGQRDRYQQFSRTARELLADFRQVEENFRRLDRNLRQQIAGWTGSKGALLDDALGSRNSIAESDQGRSFQAFYDLLLSHQRQAELTELLERLEGIEEIPEKDQRMNHVHFDWIDASERTQTTVRLLSEQLRRFLDDRVWLENRRVLDLLRGFEAKALEVRDLREPAVTMEMDDPALVGQMYIDRGCLVRRVWSTIGQHEQVGLRSVLEKAPLEQGLAELICYLSLAGQWGSPSKPDTVLRCFLVLQRLLVLSR